MDGLHIVLVVLLGHTFPSHGETSSLLSEVTRVKPGDNVTLHCDCKKSTGVYIVWYRNCSHQNQPRLVLTLKNTFYSNFLSPNFYFLDNNSLNTYDLLITNITDSDEGLYYCGTEQTRVEQVDKITQKSLQTYGNKTTRILCVKPESAVKTPDVKKNQQDCGSCWTLLLTLCPGIAVLSSLLTSLLVYYGCQKKVKYPEVAEQKTDTRGQTRHNLEEDLCYAALEIRQPSQRTRKKNCNSSDLSTYSAINTSRV